MNSNEKQENIKIIQGVTWVGAVVNILLSGLKISVGSLANSQALIADGFHSLSDLITDGAVIIGSRFWGMKYDEKHPYGHQRIETMVSLLIALLLASVAIAIGWEAVSTIQKPHTASPGAIAFFAAVVSIISKEILYRWTIKKGKEISSSALVSNAWHHRSDALSSLPVAIAVGVTFFFPDLSYLDHIAAIIISAMLLKASWNIAVPCVNEFLDAQGDRHISETLDDIKDKDKTIIEFHKIRSRTSGSSVFVDLHMLVNPTMSVANSHKITRKVEDELKKHNPRIIDVTIHVEPSEADKLAVVIDNKSKK